MLSFRFHLRLAIVVGILSSFIQISKVQAAELIKDCFQSSDFLNETELRQKINQTCVRQWAEQETQAASAEIRAWPKFAETQSFLREAQATTPALKFQVNDGHLILKDGGLVLSKDGQEETLIPRTSLPPLGAVSEFKLSPDGKKIAYGVSIDGSDISNWFFYDLKNRRQLEDAPIRLRVQYLSWDFDSAGVYYTSWPSETVEHIWLRKELKRRVPVAYHRLGTPRRSDPVIFENPEEIPSMIFGVEKSLDGTSEVAFRFFRTMQPMAIYRRTQNDSAHGFGLWKRLVSAGDSRFGRSRYLGRIQDELYFLSSQAGNELGITSFNLKLNHEPKLVLSGEKDSFVVEAQMIGQHIYLQRIDRKFQIRLSVYDLSSGRAKNVIEFDPKAFDLTAQGRMSLVTATPESSRVELSYSALTLQPVKVILDLKAFKVEVLPPSRPSHPLLAEIAVINTKYRAADGRWIPLQIFKNKNQIGKAKFALLHFYGAISVATLSSYSPKFMSILKNDGVVAIAAIRGGGELGEEWAREGALNKLKTASDIAEAARWLKRNAIVQNGKLVASGASWGGMHTYMAQVFHSDVIDAFVSLVPSSNRTYGFKGLFGWLLLDDVLMDRNSDGNIRDYEKSFEGLKTWSPFHNVSKLKIARPTLTIGSFNDERTGPEQAFFMPLAARAHFNGDANQRLIMTGGGGHSSSAALAEETAFILQQGLSNLPQENEQASQ